jgi:hypothetical protein
VWSAAGRFEKHPNRVVRTDGGQIGYMKEQQSLGAGGFAGWRQKEKSRAAAKRVRVRPYFWNWVYVFTYQRLLPKDSAQSHGSEFSGLCQLPAVDRAAVPSCIIQANARFTAVQVSSFSGSNGCIPAEPQTREFPQSHLQLRGKQRQQNSHCRRWPIGVLNFVNTVK